MKPTDFAPRAAPFDKHLTGHQLVGVEIGVDVGAHAHALLQYCSIRKLHLVDVWDKDYYRGYCEGRLHTHGYMHQVDLFKGDSLEAARHFNHETLDFVYMDQRHDYEVVKKDLVDWWPKIKPGGRLGIRNYAVVNGGLMRAVDEFVKVLVKLGQGPKVFVEMNEYIIHKP
jgi:predicted O-methyltransferase YrrM